ncbi:hypothetical protein [Flavobacterium sp. 25HG05S-40]|uniref:hypothetical protein n=1 Tax=Flavobacterium sp. 25HG05S-40 TaxID=3458682 RepID=UPI004043D92E
MQKFQYKGITFAEGWNGTFEQFQAEFSMTHVFRSIEAKERSSEMKKLFKDLIEHNKSQSKAVENIEVK